MNTDYFRNARTVGVYLSIDVGIFIANIRYEKYPYCFSFSVLRYVLP